jgi:hypothetical protein
MTATHNAESTKTRQTENGNMTATTTLADVAIQYVLRGAAQYLATHKLTATDSALAACCRAWAKIKLPEAMADAKEALACNMGSVAEMTFAASMTAAGIEAAKECGFPQ